MKVPYVLHSLYSNPGNIHISLVINFLLSCYLVLLAVGMLTVGENRLFDLTTWLLSSVLALMFIISIAFFREKQFPIIGMLSLLFPLLFLFYIFPRIASYLFFPDLVVFPFSDDQIDSDMINHGLMIVVYGTCLSLIGLFISNHIINDEIKLKISLPNYFLQSPPRIYIGVLFFVLLIDMAITSFAGISVYAQYEKGPMNTFIQLIHGLIDVDISVFVILVLIIIKHQGNERFPWLAVISISILYFAYVTFTGSRSGLLRILLMSFSIGIVVKGSFHISVKKIFIAVPIVVALGMASFSFATVQRINAAWSGEDGRYSKIMKEVELEEAKTPLTPEEKEKALETLEVKKAVKEGRAKKALEIEQAKFSVHLLMKITNQLGLLDYAILTSAKLGDENAISKYLSIEYTIKSIVNTLPGDPFPEAVLNTSRVLNIVYRGFDESYVISHGYFSEFWTVWGLASNIFSFSGGLFFFLLLGVFIGVVFNLSKYFRSPYDQVYKLVFLYLLLPLVYFSMGIDHTVVILLINILRVVVVIMILHIATKHFLTKKHSLSI